MKDTRSRIALYSAAVKRLYMWYFLSRKLDLVLVTEFPKSGASWFCKMLSDASQLSFPQNTSPSLEQCILQGHHLFHPNMRKAIFVLRDGRDIMVSAYFHFLFENSRNHPKGIKYHRRRLQFASYEDVIDNMPQFIQYMFESYPKKLGHFSWADMVNNMEANRDNICVIKYEELLVAPTRCLKKALQFYGIDSPGEDQLDSIVEEYSFKRVTQRNPGDEDRASFVRKGISGDWRTYFSSEACDVFKYYAGTALIKVGYEKDLNWSNEPA